METEKAQGLGGNIPKELLDLEEKGYISIKSGLDFCGSNVALLKFLNSFLDSIDSKADEIKKALRDEDIGFYTIKVHGLKSTSRIIGAFELSDMAKSLEKAGEAGDIEFIKNKTNELIDLLISYKYKLSSIDYDNEDKGPKPEITDEILGDAYNALLEVTPMNDYDAVETVLDELNKYKLPPEERVLFFKLKECLELMNWEKLERLVRKRISK